MFKIVYSHNEYYLYDGFNFYGSYHSMADAEYGRHDLKRQHAVPLEQAAELIGYKVVVPCLD